MSTPSARTVWLDGCSGLPYVFPRPGRRATRPGRSSGVGLQPARGHQDLSLSTSDITLVEGAVSSEEDLHKIRHIRAHTTLLVSLGDCAVTAKVPSLRNPHSVEAILQRACIENVATNPQIPLEVVPRLLRRVRPVHEVVPVDVYVPGCPPSPATIGYVLGELLEGRTPSDRPALVLVPEEGVICPDNSSSIQSPALRVMPRSRSSSTTTVPCRMPIFT